MSYTTRASRRGSQTSSSVRGMSRPYACSTSVSSPLPVRSPLSVGRGCGLRALAVRAVEPVAIDRALEHVVDRHEQVPYETDPGVQERADDAAEVDERPDEDASALLLNERSRDGRVEQ